jgi:hypothetical protein
MNSNAHQSDHLYIPDFKAWERIYQSKVPSRSGAGEKRLAIKRPAEVKLQFVSPVEETVDRAESEIKSSGEHGQRVKKTHSHLQGGLPKPIKVKDVISASAPRQESKRSQATNAKRLKVATSDSKKFNYRTLNDIFSHSR